MCVRRWSLRVGVLETAHVLRFVLLVMGVWCTVCATVSCVQLVELHVTSPLLELVASVAPDAA